MELDTDVLRSAYLADSYPSRRVFNTLPSLQNQETLAQPQSPHSCYTYPSDLCTKAPSYTRGTSLHPTLLPLSRQYQRTLCPSPEITEDDSQSRYEVEVVHVENTTVADEDVIITCNVDAKSPRAVIVDLDMEQTTTCRQGDLDSVLDSGSDFATTDKNNKSDKNTFEIGKSFTTCEINKVNTNNNCNRIAWKSGEMDMETEKVGINQVSPKRKWVDTDEQYMNFRFGSRLRRKSCLVSHIPRGSTTQQVDKHSHQHLHGSEDSPHGNKSDSPLASLSRYCEMLTSGMMRRTHINKPPVQSDVLYTSEHVKSPMHYTIDDTQGSFTNSTSLNLWNIPRVPQRNGFNPWVESPSWRSMFVQHTVVPDRRPICEPLPQDRHKATRSWHRPAPFEATPAPKKTEKFSENSFKSSLFDFGVCNTLEAGDTVMAPDTMDNKENQPQKYQLCNTEFPTAINDSDISSAGESSSFKRDVCVSNPCNTDCGSNHHNQKGQNKMTTKENYCSITNPQVCVNDWDSHKDPSNAFISRRRYILSGSGYDAISQHPANHQTDESRYAQLQPGLQSNLEKVKSKNPVISGILSRNTGVDGEQIIPLPSLSTSPIQSNSDLCKSSCDQSPHSDTRYVLNSPSEETFSDFKALFNAFDKSPVKQTLECSQVQGQFPVFNLALAETTSAGTQQETSLPTKTRKLLTCHCCGRDNLKLKAYRRHELRKYSCLVCEERFCLQYLLYKHKSKCFSPQVPPIV